MPMTLAEKPSPLALRATPDGKILAFACPICTRAYSVLGYEKAAENEANSCCAPLPCKECGKQRESHECTFCVDCTKKKEAELLLQRLRQAQNVIPASDWKGPVHIDGSDEEGWAHDVGDLLADARMKEKGLPSWVWGCTTESLSLNAGCILENATSDGMVSEAACEAAQSGEEDLQKLLDVWAKAHKVTWWEEYDDVVVVLDEERFFKETGVSIKKHSKLFIRRLGSWGIGGGTDRLGKPQNGKIDAQPGACTIFSCASKH